VKIRINIHLKSEILDPEGKAIQKVIERAGYDNVKNVRVSKTVDMEIEETGADALQIATEIAEKILINPVIHEADIEKL